MSGLLFVSQAMLESWVEQGKIEFAGNVMTLRAGEGEGRTYALEPAVRFLRVVGADEDPHCLVDEVKRVAELKGLGADTAGNSCIVGDVAYDLEPGFIAGPLPAAPPHAARGEGAGAPTGGDAAEQASAAPDGSDAAARSRPLGATALPKELEGKRKEAEALARFLLENLS